MSAFDPVPRLIEDAFDHMDRVFDHLAEARNAIAEGKYATDQATHEALAMRDLMLELRAATDSFKRTRDEQSGEINIVAPTAAVIGGFTNSATRQRRITVAVCVLVILILVVALAVV